MAISNTSILIKRSSSTSTPASLQNGELAYSFSSNTIFIGGPGSSVLKIGGQAYTSQIDAATSSNTVSTLVKRDSSGGFSGQLYGNANTASSLQNAQNFSISGGDISATGVAFYGNNAVALNASLNSIPGLSAGTYGSSSAVPVVTVAANGRVTAISTSAISTSFNISDGTTSNTINAGASLYFKPGGGVTTTVSANTVTFGTDNTVLRSNTTGLGVQTVSTDLTVAGNLIVTGTQTFVNTSTVVTNDSLIKLAANNTVADVVDIGFYGASNTGSSVTYSGLIREGSGGSAAGNFYLFKNLATDPTGNTVNYSGLTAANLIAGVITANALYSSNGVVSTGVYTGSYSDGIILDYQTGNARISAGTGDGFTFYNAADTTRVALMNISSSGVIGTASWGGATIGTGYGGTGLTSFTSGGALYATSSSALTTGTLPFTAGGTGATSFTNGQLVIAAGSSLQSLANSTYTLTGGLSAANTITSLTVDAYGRVTAATGAAISGLTVSQGGTGQSSFTNGQLIVGSGTGALQQIANVSTSVTGSLLSNNTITSITTDAYGRLTAYTGSAISGLTVPQGGTGLTTATLNGITFGNGVGALGVTAAAGSSDQTWSNQILTVTNAGVPVWSSALDGGTF